MLLSVVEGLITVASFFVLSMTNSLIFIRIPVHRTHVLWVVLKSTQVHGGSSFSETIFSVSSNVRGKRCSHRHSC